ncbi:hypothetical protein MLD38_028134 [Melastoma candidum]|uniref:Uncharacterized protein n=1 Tax=Melastoma candidum TaxID=119954 RepID=A0ACB9MZW4_9MYRT|nr:hypothetical protein MLD38_028134 [Melastoma candidum]
MSIRFVFFPMILTFSKYAPSSRISEPRVSCQGMWRWLGEDPRAILCHREVHRGGVNSGLEELSYGEIHNRNPPSTLPYPRMASTSSTSVEGRLRSLQSIARWLLTWWMFTTLHSNSSQIMFFSPGLASKYVPKIISTALNQTIQHVSAASSSCSNIRKRRRGLGQLERQALADCIDLFDSTVSELAGAVHDLSIVHPEQRYRDLQTLLSGAMTNQYMCLDGFAFSKEKDVIRELFEGSVVNISHLVSNSLVMLRKLPGRPSAKADEGEAFPGYGKDGTGDFNTVEEAITASPNNSSTRFVIYVNAGAYFENVEIVRKKTNLILLGDGIGQTLVKAARNVVDSSATFRSATFGESSGFPN